MKFLRLGITERTWEMLYPYITGGIVLVGCLSWRGFSPESMSYFKNILPELYSDILAFASIMAGFASTLIGIVFSIRDSRKIKQLEQIGLFAVLKQYLIMAVFWNTLLSVLCIVAKGLYKCHIHLCWAPCLIIVTLFAVSLLSQWRVTRIMCQLL